MSFRFSFNSRVQTRSVSASPPGKKALFGGAALLIAMLFLLYNRIGFADYALTGIFWADADGAVISLYDTSDPVVEFVTPDGVPHRFSEDYMALCTGRTTICFARDFTVGEHVPVVYDPAVPTRAFIHDWALLSTAFMWFFEAAVMILFALMMAVAVTRRPVDLQLRLQRSTGFPDSDK